MKKFKILALFFAGVFAVVFAGVFAFAGVAFLPPVPLFAASRFDFEFGRGVRGFVDMVEGGSDRGAEMPPGGVGALPVDGRAGLEDGLTFSRGLRNIARSQIHSSSFNRNRYGISDIEVGP